MAEMSAPFTIDKEMRIKWSVPYRMVPNRFEELCRRILEGKKTEEEVKQESSDDDDDFLGKLVNRRSCDTPSQSQACREAPDKRGSHIRGKMAEDTESSEEENEDKDVEKQTSDAEYQMPINYIKCGGDDSNNSSTPDGTSGDPKPLTEEEIEETMREVRRIRLGENKPKKLDLGFSRLQHVTDISLEFMCGPTLPNVPRLLELTKKTSEEVLKVLSVVGVTHAEWEEFVQGRNELFNLWSPVLARVAMWTSRPLVRLLRREDPRERLGWGTQGEDRVWRISTLPTIGETCRTALKVNDKLETSKRILLKGWYQWEGRSLTEDQVDQFFSGMEEEAERVGVALLQLSKATDSKLLFRMFMEF